MTVGFAFSLFSVLPDVTRPLIAVNQHLAMQNLGDDDRCQVRLNFFVGDALEEAFGISGCSRDVIEEDVGVNQARPGTTNSPEAT